MYDVVIVGAGAAGMMAAIRAGKLGHKVLVIEKMEKAGRKIRITGKGRCNITNTRPREEFLEHIRANRDFFARSFDRCDNNKTIAFFRTEGLKLDIERGDRVYPSSGKAWDVAETLKYAALDAGVEFMFDSRVRRISVVGNKVRGITIFNKRGFERRIECSNVIIATGGASYPATGSTGDGYKLAHDTGHRIVEVRPSLVGLDTDSEYFPQLKGVKLKNVEVTLVIEDVPARSEFGEMEFGTRGIEGPVILKLSRDAVDAVIDGKKVGIRVDLKTALDREILLARFERELDAMESTDPAIQLVRKLVPKPLVPVIMRMAGIEFTKPATALTEEDKERLVVTLKGMEFNISDYRPFEEAVVTAGGVDIQDVDPDTLESRVVTGLYFCGEVLDIDADTGGYNLQVAFSTGYVAGMLGKGGDRK